MISVHSQGKPFNIRVIQVCALTTNAEEVEVGCFSEDLQDLLELIAKKMSFSLSVQFSQSVVSDSATQWTATHQAFLFITNFWSLIKLMSIQSVMSSNHLILSCPLLLCLQSIPASGSFQVSQFFASGGQSIILSASASVLPMNIQD